MGIIGPDDSADDTSSTDPANSFTDPAEELRDAAGAADGATGSEIMASGGDPIAGAISIVGSGTGGSSGPTQGTVNRLVESGATDAPSDIAAKASGETDPNPGHTDPAETSASTTSTTPNQSAGMPSIGSVLPDLGGTSLVMWVVGGILALVTLGGVAAAGD